MLQLAQQRCFNHAVREAVARCPQCTRFYCRECVTEHDDRLLCAACLTAAARPPLTQRNWFRVLVRTGAGVAGLALAWFCFHGAGRILLSIPDSFHEGTLWQVPWVDR